MLSTSQFHGDAYLIENSVTGNLLNINSRPVTDLNKDQKKPS